VFSLWIDFSRAAVALMENNLSFQEQFMFASVPVFVLVQVHLPSSAAQHR
jgi:hypothetical protein